MILGGSSSTRSSRFGFGPRMTSRRRNTRRSTRRSARTSSSRSRPPRSMISARSEASFYGDSRNCAFSYAFFAVVVEKGTLTSTRKATSSSVRSCHPSEACMQYYLLLATLRVRVSGWGAILDAMHGYNSLD